MAIGEGLIRHNNKGIVLQNSGSIGRMATGKVCSIPVWPKNGNFGMIFRYRYRGGLNMELDLTNGIIVFNEVRSFFPDFRTIGTSPRIPHQDFN